MQIKQYSIDVYTRQATKNGDITKRETFRLYDEVGALWENIKNYADAEKAMKKALKKDGYAVVAFGVWDDEDMKMVQYHVEHYYADGVEGMTLAQVFDATEQNA